MKKVYSLFCLLCIVNVLNAEMRHTHRHTDLWTEENLFPFDELMLSWNGNRPSNGKFLFYISVKTEDWSPWLLYASWGSEGQSSYQAEAEGFPAKVFQDALEMTQGVKATAFKVKVIAEDASKEDIHHLHVYTNGDKASTQESNPSTTVLLKVPGLSQMALSHERRQDLCSPTSTTAVTRYLSHNPEIDPVAFADDVWDSGFDIYGNWVFSVAQASTYLGKEGRCWVERLSGFDAIHQSLSRGFPVVVSVRGPLPGSASPYAKGHLLAVIGYDAANQKVLVMDPAFPSDDQTHTSYALSDFMQAWARRGNVAYFFTADLTPTRF